MRTTTWARLGFERFLCTSSRGIFQTSPHGDARPVSERNTLPACANLKTTETAQNQLRPTTRRVIEELKKGTAWNTMMRGITITDECLPMPAYAGRKQDTMLPTPQGTATLWQITSNGTDHHSIKAGPPRTKRDWKGTLLIPPQLYDPTMTMAHEVLTIGQPPVY